MKRLLVLLALTFVAPAYADEDYTLINPSVNVNQLTRELKAATVPIHGISKSGQQVTVHISGKLTAAQRNTMTSVVASHVAQPEKTSRDDWKAAYANATTPLEKIDLMADYLGLR